ncbi:hypothetical protein ADK77_31610 [Streptomyces antibioticus]|nr:hypothetical protein ADK77_31610 [Streptomyces antibioticus]
MLAPAGGAGAIRCADGWSTSPEKPLVTEAPVTETVSLGTVRGRRTHPVDWRAGLGVRGLVQQ